MDGSATQRGHGRVEDLTGSRRRLVNEFQREFPLTTRPFRDVAGALGWDEETVIDALAELTRAGVVSRVGPVIRPNTIGVSTLAAMSVPAERLERVAAAVSRQPEVNHNYEREHRFNLWFVLAAGNAGALESVVRRIESQTGLGVMVLPMLDDYYIDLGFDLDGEGKPHAPAASASAGVVDDADRRLLQAVQEGLPLVARPYAAVADAIDAGEQDVRSRLRALLDTGVVKRLGVIVRHHECGYRHNAMVVWDVPDHLVQAAGRRLAGMESVRLCYRRPRRMPGWPYNLFCMIHGREREAVRREVERVSAAAGLQDRPRDILFSGRRYKQRGARYDLEPGAGPREAVGT